MLLERGGQDRGGSRCFLVRAVLFHRQTRDDRPTAARAPASRAAGSQIAHAGAICAARVAAGSAAYGWTGRSSSKRVASCSRAPSVWMADYWSGLSRRLFVRGTRNHGQTSKQRIRPDITGWNVFAIVGRIVGAPDGPAPSHIAKCQAGDRKVPSTTVTIAADPRGAVFVIADEDAAVAADRRTLAGRTTGRGGVPAASAARRARRSRCR